MEAQGRWIELGGAIVTGATIVVGTLKRWLGAGNIDYACGWIHDGLYSDYAALVTALKAYYGIA